MIVNGKIVMLNQRILTLDEAKIMKECQNAAEELMVRSQVAKQSFPWNWNL